MIFWEFIFQPARSMPRRLTAIGQAVTARKGRYRGRGNKSGELYGREGIYFSGCKLLFVDY